MHWVIAALSLAQVAQGLVPVVGESQTGAAKAALKTFSQHSGVRETIRETTGSTLPDLDHQGIIHGQLLPPRDLNGRRLHTMRVRKPATNDVVAAGGFTERGELTYYGGAGENGACSQTFVPAGFTTVAINQEQWKGGAECGTCVEGCFTNGFDDSGERCFKAIVDNLCPECVSGDLDMGEDNGGRWPLQWKFIDCPSGDLKLLTEGGNKWYAKLKVQGGPSSVTSMKCAYSGKSVDGAFTDDGFFEFWDRTPETFSCTGMSCSLSFSRGGSGSIEISTADLGSKCEQ